MKDEAFLEAILASPQDEALRLVYADWLEERGDRRGELLRVNHELSQTPLDSGRYRRLRSRRDNLRKGCDARWLKTVLRPSWAQVRKRVDELARLDAAHAVFASDAHQYRLDPPLPVGRVEQIESRLGFRLPEQYRQFVTQFAGGGAGPDYGINPLESLIPADADPARLAALAGPFPAPANVEEMRALGYSPPGTLAVCEIGCGGYHHLILSGPERGRVWVQNPDGDWSPELLDESFLPGGGDVGLEAVLDAAIRAPEGFKLDFLDWYAKWLDEALWQVSYRAASDDDLFDLAPETTEVGVTGRTMAALPDRLRQLTALRSLNLHANGLTELPEWIGELTDLEFLVVGGNPLRCLPESIGELGRLRRLSCSGTKTLEQLPDGIGRLAGLEALQLSFNLLRAVPEGIGRLHRLRDLELHHNQLTALPATMGDLRELRTLRLTWNKLSDLPATLAGLPRLERLDLRANQFRRLPDCVGRLPALHTLNLGENPGLDLADACRRLAAVPTLRHLSLFMNKLTELPDEIGLLTQLTSLDVSWNQLARLPASLARMGNLERINLDHNPDVRGLHNQLRALLPELE